MVAPEPSIRMCKRMIRRRCRQLCSAQGPEPLGLKHESAAHGAGVVTLTAGLVMIAASPAEAEDRIFWANTGDRSGDQYDISSAALDETGGGADLVTGSAPRESPLGTTIDTHAGRIYWVNTAVFGTPTIAYAALDGSGGGTLDTTGATLSQPGGLALDPVGRRIYWTNLALNTISYAKLRRFRWWRPLLDGCDRRPALRSRYRPRC